MKGKDEIKKNYNHKTEVLLQCCPEYMRDFAADFIDKSAITRYTYVGDVKNFLNDIADKKDININESNELNKIRKYDINEYITSIHGSDSYKARVTYALKYFFNFMEENRYINGDPAAKIVAPKDKKNHEVTSLTVSEVKLIMKQIKKLENVYVTQGAHKRLKLLTPQEEVRKSMKINRNLSIFLLGITTGLRCAEIISINLEDLDLKKKTISIIEKGGYERTVFMSDELISYIKVYMKYRKQYLNGTNCEALFINVKKKRCNYSEINRMLAKATEGLDKHITPHKMRSTYATTLYDQTGDIYLVAQGLNHKNIKNTMRYAKPSEEKNRAAADLMGNVFGK